MGGQGHPLQHRWWGLVGAYGGQGPPGRRGVERRIVRPPAAVPTAASLHLPCDSLSGRSVGGWGEIFTPHHCFCFLPRGTIPSGAREVSSQLNSQREQFECSHGYCPQT